MKKVDFENGSIVSNIFQTAFPMLVAQVINLLYNIVDRIYIGRIEEIGTSALGAVGLCYPVIILVMAFTNMFGLGGAPLFSMELGRGNKEKAEAIINSAFRAELFCSVIIIVIVEFFAGPLLMLFGATQSELVYSVPYLRIYILGTSFAMLSTGINPYINGQGYAVIGMVTVTLGAVVNLILDPVLIFACGMGVNGAAIATVFAQFLSAYVVIKFLLSDKNEYRIKQDLRIACGEAGKSAIFPFIRDIIGLGMAPFIMQVTNSLVSIACNSVLMRCGGAMYVSVMTIINSVRQILETPVLALADGSSPAISFNYGAKRPEKVRQAILIMSSMAIGYTLVTWIFIEKFPSLLIGIFSNDKALQEMAVGPLHLYFYAFIFQALQYSGQTTFKSLNKKNFAIFFSIFRKVVLVVPLTYGLSYFFGMGTNGVFCAEPVSNLVGGSLCFGTMLLTVMPELKRMEERQK